MTNNISKDIKKYQLSTKEKIGLWLRIYESDESVVESIKTAKFIAINEFASNLVAHHGISNISEERVDFDFTLDIDSLAKETLKDFLRKNKNLVLDYIISGGDFIESHLYQLYLEYIPYELTEVQKSILLDGYITTLTDLKGQTFSNSKRKILENKLSLNNRD